MWQRRSSCGRINRQRGARPGWPLRGIVVLGLLAFPGEASTIWGMMQISPRIGALGRIAREPVSRDPVSRDPVVQDPALRTGTLPNGLRYYLRSNATPTQRAELQLIVHAGSVQEEEAQRGFAHVLTHLAFRGTRRFPGPALLDELESGGMDVDVHRNTVTTFTSTVYRLTVPTDTLTRLSRGLELVADWAGGQISFDSVAVLGERDIILAEWRDQNPTEWKKDKEDEVVREITRTLLEARYGSSSHYSERAPIGVPAALKLATPATLERFYRKWYRPDHMAVVVVGDFDAATTESWIRTYFGRIPIPKTPRPSSEIPGSGSSIAPVTVVRTLTPPQVTVRWPKASGVRTVPDARALVRQELIERLLLTHLQSALLQRQIAPQRSFISANLTRETLNKPVGDVLSLRVVAASDSLNGALLDALTEIERVAQHGIAANVLQQQASVLLTQLEQAATQEPTTPSRVLSQQYLQHELSKTGSLLSAVQTSSLAREILPSITPANLATAARFWRDRSRWIVTYQYPPGSPGPSPEPTSASVAAAADALTRVPLSEAQSTTPPSLLSALPAPGKILEEQTDESIGLTVWTLANGARVVYKRALTQLTDLSLYARSLGGTSVLQDSIAFNPGRLVAEAITATSGLETPDGALETAWAIGNTEILDRPATAASFRMALTHTEETVRIAGPTEQAEQLFQRVYRLFTIPPLDSAAVKQWKYYGRGMLYRSENDSLAVAATPENRRLLPPAAAQVGYASVSQALQVYQDRFTDAGDFTFVIVGAIPVAQVKTLVEQYVASLPSRGRTQREQPKGEFPRSLSNLRGEFLRDTHVLRQTKIVIYDAPLMVSDASTGVSTYFTESQRFDAAMTILQRRLRHRFSGKLATVYAPAASVVTYASPNDRYRVRVQLYTPPQHIDDAQELLEGFLKDLRTSGITPDEVALVNLIQRRQWEKRRDANSYWVNTIFNYDRLGIPLKQLSNPLPPTLTAEDIRQAILRYLPGNQYQMETLQSIGQ